MKFEDHKDLDIPHGHTVVWRYMGLDKFLDLLIHNRIFFSNAASLTDQYEVSIPDYSIRQKRIQLEKEGLYGRDLEEELANYQYVNSPMRDLTLVNCWSLGKTESYALWKIYLGGSRAGVAIRTNISLLKKAILSANKHIDVKIYISKIDYSDYIKDSDLSRFKLITKKREFYKYEDEVRLFILDYPRSEGGTKRSPEFSKGLYYDIDVNILIKQIFISPFVGLWFMDSIKEIIRKIAPGLNARVLSSSIRDV